MWVPGGTVLEYEGEVPQGKVFILVLKCAYMFEGSLENNILPEREKLRNG